MCLGNYGELVLYSSAYKVLAAQEDVPGGQVTMDDPFCLEIFHGIGNLSGIRVEQSKVLGGAIFPQESVEIAIRSKLLYLSLYMDSILGSIYGIWSVYYGQYMSVYYGRCNLLWTGHYCQ